jgi:hypothetical protein
VWKFPITNFTQIYQWGVKINPHHSVTFDWLWIYQFHNLHNFDTRWQKVVSFPLRSLYSHPYTSNRRTGGHRSRSERYGEEKNLLPTENRMLDLPARSLVITPPELSIAAQHYSAHCVVAVYCNLNLRLLWHTIFTVLTRAQWFPSLKHIKKHLAGKRCATDDYAKQAVTSWLLTPHISTPPRYRCWRNDGPNAVMSMVSWTLVCIICCTVTDIHKDYDKEISQVKKRDGIISMVADRNTRVITLLYDTVNMVLAAFLM